MFQRWFKSSGSAPQTTTDNGEGLTHISTDQLIGMHHDAERIQLGVSKIRSLQSGSYRSHLRGRGMEFDEVRPYQPGDDIRSIEWRVTARTGKPHTKLFCEERERSVLLCVDLRDNMMFATQGAFKSVRACVSAALLGWSAEHSGDRVGGLLFSNHQHQEFRPGNGKPALIHLLKQLAEHPAWQDGTTSSEQSANALTEALTRIRRVASSGSLIFIISDFSHLQEKNHAQIAQLSRHNELILIFIYDPIEQQLPPAGQYRIQQAGQELMLDTSSDTQRKAHQQHFEQRLQTLKRFAKRPGVHLLPMTTSDNPATILSRYFRG